MKRNTDIKLVKHCVNVITYQVATATQNADVVILNFKILKITITRRRKFQFIFETL